MNSKKMYRVIYVSLFLCVSVAGLLVLNSIVPLETRVQLGVQQYIADKYPGQQGTIYCREKQENPGFHECWARFDDARLITVECEGRQCSSPKLPFHMESKK